MECQSGRIEEEVAVADLKLNLSGRSQGSNEEFHVCYTACGERFGQRPDIRKARKTTAVQSENTKIIGRDVKNRKCFHFCLTQEYRQRLLEDDIGEYIKT